MNLGELRRLTAGMPDETEIVVDGGDVIEFFEVHHRANFFAVMDLPPVVSVYMGQEVTTDYMMGERIDAWLG